MKGLKGQIAVVTGASSGIGQAIAQRLAEEGCHVVINYRGDLEGAKATEAEALRRAKIQGYTVKTLVVQADVSKEEDVVAMMETVINSWGRCDILINNAGIQTEMASHDVTTDAFDKVIDVNLRGAYLCAREAIQQFLKQARPGVIINVSSVHEIIPRPLYVSYSISKGAWVI